VVALTKDEDTHMITRLLPGDALVVVDVQNDFLPGGALAVPRGEEIIPVLNRYIAGFVEAQLPIFATRDWHPPDHCSFRTQGGIWPVHCVQYTPGADFSPSLRLPPSRIIISKETDSSLEAYSGFEGTELCEHLHSHSITHIYCGGLATDYCVLNTVKDALCLGFKVVLLTDAVRAVNVKPEDGNKAQDEMIRLGAIPFHLTADPKPEVSFGMARP
jgi:nicotinamidase/pyrazinamidase